MRTALAPVVALLALLALASPAAASSSCPEQDLSRPFLPWLDLALYEAAPDGGFEAGGESWTLTGGAAVVDGGRPNGGGSSALELPAGATATTAPVCVSVVHPTVRFFVRGSGLATASVLVDGQQIPIGVANGGGVWAPALPLPVVVNLLGTQQVRFQLVGVGALRIDDFYIDPYSKG